MNLANFPNRRIHIIVLVFCIFFCGNIFGQNSGPYGAVADSFSVLVKNSADDTSKVFYLNELGWEVMFYNPDTAIILGEQALDIAIKIATGKEAHGNTSLKRRAQVCIAQSYSNLGVYYWLIGEYTQAINHHLKALDIRLAMNDMKNLGSTYTNIGSVYFSQADYPKALEYFFKALKISMNLQNGLNISRDLGNIGAVYNELKDYNKALEYFLDAIEIEKKMNDKDGMQVMLGNVGAAYQSLKNYDKALQYYQQTLELCKELGNKRSAAINLGNIGSVYEQQGKYTEALNNYYEALEISDELEDKRSKAVWLGNIGRVFRDLKKYAEGEEFLLKALAVSAELNELSLIKDQSSELSDIYERTGQYKLAFQYLKQYISSNDSLFNDEKSKDIGRLEARHEMELAEMERLKKIEEETKVNARARNRRYLLQYSGIVILLLVLGLIIALLGFIKVTPGVARGISFFALLLLFEFMIVLLDPKIDKFSGGGPAYKLFFNALIAILIFPIHAFFEKYLFKRLIKRRNEKSNP